MAQRDDVVIVNVLVRQALVAAQEVMGENGLNAVLHISGLETHCMAKGDPYCRFEVGEATQ